jgi:membrane-associated phospholipid phosphatase
VKNSNNRAGLRIGPAAVVVIVMFLVCNSVAQVQVGGNDCCAKLPASTSGIESETQSKGRDRPGNLFRLFAEDQKTLWSSPIRLRAQDVPWVIGVAGATALLIGSDTAIQAHVGAQHVGISRLASDGGVALFAGAAGTFYGVGAFTKNEHARETGRLTGEAAIDALAMNSTLQLALQRARPGEKDASEFFSGGSSFPSNHAAVAWAAASVIAHEYPGWSTKALSYGLASAVSITRITGEKHFSSDVFVGSTLGWFVGQQIYRKRHDKDLPGDSWGTFNNRVERVPDPMRNASPYVPLDSWVYPAMDRLAALGEAPGGFQGLRPWTRMECARLLKEALDAKESGGAVEGDSAYSDLEREFADELQILNGGSNVRARIESVYTRVTGISGPPLTDSFHFGQTLTNDYGRPFQEGLNLVTGVSADAEAGPVVFYARGEYQHAPGAPALSDQVRTATAASDQLPISPAAPFISINRFRLLDAYAALNFSGWQASFGKQSFWWGPGAGGDLMLSNNAEPLYMFAFSRVSPLRLPSVFGWLGEVKPAFFLGQLQGYNFLRLGPNFVLTGSYDRTINPQPFIWGGKLSLKPTPNLEFGFSMTTVYAGLGRPLTLDTFLHTFSASGNGQPLEPGDRRTGFDFSYRIPGLRKWLVLYNGSMAEDEPNPIAYPRRSAMNPGIYLPQIPKFRKLDFRAEGVYTNLPDTKLTGMFYTNMHYAGGYRNYGEIMGSWIGPQASGVQLWSTYWWSGQKKLQFGYRKQSVDPAYVGGGSLQDFSGQYDFPLGKDLAISSCVQYERWQFPVIANGPNSNVAVSVQFTYKPRWGGRASRR